MPYSVVHNSNMSCLVSCMDIIFKIHITVPALCILVYRLPKIKSNIIEDLPSSMAPHSDKLLTVGDFHIPTCSSKSMATEFLFLYSSSFHFIHLILGSTCIELHTRPCVACFHCS